MAPKPWLSAAIVAVTLAACMVALPAPLAAQPTADENFRIEHEIGRKFRVDPDDLPPRTNVSASNGPRVIAYAGQAPTVPPGFTATRFATAIINPRRLLVLPNGDVLVAQQSTGRVLRLRDDGSGKATQVDSVDGFRGPYGLALRGNELLVTDQNGIWRVPASTSRPELITRSGVFGMVQGHNNRPLAIDPQSGRLFVGVGSMAISPSNPSPRQRSSASTPMAPIS